MNSDIKQSEIDVYDDQDETRPEYGSLWDTEHQKALLDYGPEGEFQSLLDEQKNSGDILVLGCGNGRKTKEISEQSGGSRVWGIELSSDRLHTAAEQGSEKTSFARADAEQLPFKNETFEIVVAHSVLHHLPSWETEGLDEIIRVLTDTGSLLFYEPGKYNPPAVVRRHFVPSRIHTSDEQPFNPLKLRDTLSCRFDSVEMTGHCIFSNIIPVIDNYIPLNIPYEFTTKVYWAEKLVMSRFDDRPAWILTGAAESPY